MSDTQRAITGTIEHHLSKPLKVFATRGVVASIGEQTASEILIEILKLFPDHPYDMYVIGSTGEEGSSVKLAGYHLVTNDLDETTVIASFSWHLGENIWFKVDDYGEHFVGTLLLPEEY